MNKLKTRIFFVALAMSLFLYGVAVEKYRLFPIHQINAAITEIKNIFKIAPKVVLIKGYSDTSQKIEVDCNAIDKRRTMVILAYGQGNSANGGEVKYQPKQNVFNVFRGKCYIADDPLLGTTDNKGSVWGRLSDIIIENGMYDNVIIKSIGVGGSPMISWTVNGTGTGYQGKLFGNYHEKILQSNEELKSLGFPITHILWHQGESDTINETTTLEYKEQFLNMLSNMRKNGINAPIFVAQASRYGKKTSSDVIHAQIQLAEEHDDIFKGPNTDIIDKIQERTDDGQRFSELGLEKHANAWLDILIKHSSL